MQRSRNTKKQKPFFTFLFVVPKLEIIFAPSYAIANTMVWDTNLLK